MCDKQRKVIISKSSKLIVVRFSNKMNKIMKKVIFYLTLE